MRKEWLVLLLELVSWLARGWGKDPTGGSTDKERMRSTLDQRAAIMPPAGLDQRERYVKWLDQGCALRLDHYLPTHPNPRGERLEVAHPSDGWGGISRWYKMLTPQSGKLSMQGCVKMIESIKAYHNNKVNSVLKGSGPTRCQLI